MSTQQITKTSATSKLSEIKSLISGAIEDLLKAAGIVVEILDADEMDVHEIGAKTGVPVSFVRGLERVGRKKLKPELFLAETPGQRALAKLPYELQERYLEHPIKLLLLKESGKPDELEASIDVMTAEQVAQAFTTNRVRDLSEQRAWIEGSRLRKMAAPSTVDDPYVKIGRKIRFKKDCLMDARQIATLLVEMQT